MFEVTAYVKIRKFAARTILGICFRVKIAESLVANGTNAAGNDDLF